MTRILAVADLHIGATHLCTLDEQERALDEVREIVVREKVDVVLIGGDLFHHNRPSPQAIALAGRFFGGLGRIGIDAVMARGNHDPDAAEIVSYFRGRVWVPASPEIIQHPSGIDIAIMPYLPDRFVRAAAAGSSSRESIAHELTQAALEIIHGFAAQRRPGVPLVFLGHATVAGTQTSTGWGMGFVGGTDWRIDDTELMRFDLAIVGHVHRHQAAAENVVIPGSLLPLDFAETDAHGVIVADIGELRDGCRLVPLTCAPIVSTWEIVPSEVQNLIHNRQDWPVSAGEKIRIRYRVDEATAREYPPAAIARPLYDAGASLVQVDLEVEREDRARDAAFTDELTPGRALEQLYEDRDVAPALRSQIFGKGATVLTEVAMSSVAPGAAGDLRVARLEAHDFLGLAHAELDLEGVDVASLCGPVGAGKSSLGCDVARFGLFGESRIGGKASERLIRQGAEAATVAVELRSESGDRYRVVRKLKRSSRGVASTLDVLAHAGDAAAGEWRPLSTGKVIDGEAAVAGILGGLTDQVVTAANFVVQRDADRFTRARPEERKRLIAEAAGLHIYDRLAEASAEHRRTAERELEQLQAAAGPLRARADALPRLEAELADIDGFTAGARGRVDELQARHTEVLEGLERASARVADYERILGDATRIQAEIDRLLAEGAEWDRKLERAAAALGRRDEIAQARTKLEVVRGVIAAVEASLTKATAAAATRAAKLQERSTLESRIRALKSAREAQLRVLDAKIEAARRKGELVDQAACCAPEPECVFLVDARAALASVSDLERDVEVAMQETHQETELMARALDIEIPDEPTPVVSQEALLRARRAEARELEQTIAGAEDVARAAQVKAEHGEATARLAGREQALRAELKAANAQLIGFRGNPRGERDRLQAEQRTVEEQLRGARELLEEYGRRGALLAGRIETMREAAAELEELEGRIRAAAAGTAAWKQLVDDWRACRVLVLEGSVIPSVEDLSNEILRQFPYGLQIRFSTQRDLKSGEGKIETLDIEVIGPAPLYELCSGGQRTAIDIALHTALAVVVGRRSSTRLSLLYLDEPEGLDEPGRMALARIVRRLHDEHGLTVILATHHSDLADAVGGLRIDIEGEPGNARVGAAVVVPA